VAVLLPDLYEENALIIQQSAPNDEQLSSDEFNLDYPDEPSYTESSDPGEEPLKNQTAGASNPHLDITLDKLLQGSADTVSSKVSDEVPLTNIFEVQIERLHNRILVHEVNNEELEKQIKTQFEIIELYQAKDDPMFGGWTGLIVAAVVGQLVTTSCVIPFRIRRYFKEKKQSGE